MDQPEPSLNAVSSLDVADNATQSATTRLAQNATRTSRWLLCGRLATYVGTIGVSAIWVALDHRSPSWDQSHYLFMALHYWNAFLAGGVHPFIHLVRTIDPGRAPLYSIALMPFGAVFGSSGQSALVLNLFLWAVLLFSVHQIASSFFDKRAGLFAMVLTATVPLIVYLSHQVLQDFMVVTATTLVVMLIVRADFFARRWLSIALGVALGVAALVKVSTLLFDAGPMFICCAQTCRMIIHRQADAQGRRLARSRLLNMAAALTLGAALTLSWYVPNLKPTLEYLQLPFAATSGAVGPSNPIQLGAVLAYTGDVIQSSLSWFIALAGALAAILVVANKVQASRRDGGASRFRPRYRALFLGTWIAIPYLASALSNNHDTRYLVSSLPGVAVLVAGLVVSINSTVVRRAVMGTTAGLCIWQTVSVTLPLPSAVKLPSAIPFSASVGGYSDLPAPKDFSAAMMDYLETRSRANGRMVPERVALLETLPYVNGNTLGYMAYARSDPFIFKDVFRQPAPSLQHTLSTFDFVMFVPPVGEDAYTLGVNGIFARGEVTPQLVSQFSHLEILPAGYGETVEILDNLPSG